MTGKSKRHVTKKKLTKIIIVGCLVFLLGPSSAKGEEYTTIIVEKNLFSPTRQKWVTPEKVPPKKEINKSLMPELCGTIVTKNKKVALFRFSQSSQAAQPVQPQKTHIRRKARKAGTPPAVSPRTFITRSYCVGDIINGCLLAKIKEDRVRLECEGEKIRLFLH
jgi:hypothetical protein